VGILSVLPCAGAADWYVDVQNGSDANSGSSPNAAWRTLTHAVYHFPASTSPQLIHVAPGTYDAAHGEQYPIQPPPWIQIVGTQGSAATILDGGGAKILIYQTAV